MSEYVTGNLTQTGKMDFTPKQDPEYTYDLGKFHMCSGHFNYETGLYEKSPDMNVFKCCLEQNKGILDKCTQKCRETLKNPEKCISVCEDIHENAKRICQRKITDIHLSENNPYYTCVKKFGCKLSDKHCAEQNRYDIERCCFHKCTPTQEVDCQYHCSVRNVSENITDMLFGESDKSDLVLNIPKDGDENYQSYIITSIAAAIITIIILYFVLR